MKKKLLPLALAAAAGFTGVTAQAQMHLNHDGTGQLLMYPIYTANGGNDTYVSVANTTSDYKAVKVRLVDAMNSQDSLDFHLYLSPQDHWSAVITKNPNGDGAILRTGDTSCTVPNRIAATAVGGLGDAIEARNAKYAVGGAEADAINNGVDRSLEGHVEIIEMGTFNYDQAGGSGTVDDNPVTGADFSTDHQAAITALKAAIKHSNGVPGKCSDLQAAWTEKAGGAAAVNSASGAFFYTDSTSQKGDFTQAAIPLAAPTGGLYGYGVIINVPDGTAAMFDAVAVEGFMASGYHPTPGDDEPGIDDGVNTARISKSDGTTATFLAGGLSAVDGLAANAAKPAVAGTDVSLLHVDTTRGATGSRLAGGGQVVAAMVGTATESFDYYGDQSTNNTFALVTNDTIAASNKGLPGSKEALTALLARTGLTNDYVLEPGLNAATDWVVTFPTKRDFVNFEVVTGTGAVQHTAGQAPFTSAWNHATTQSCDNISISYWDREEGENVVDVQFDISPAPVTVVTSASLCVESNIINFNGKGVLGGSTRITQDVALASGFNNGWARLNFTGTAAGTGVVGAADTIGAETITATTARGLPVIGFAIQKYVNNSATSAGALANYAGSIGHHYTSNVTD